MGPDRTGNDEASWDLPEVAEPFHQLGCVVFVELDVREVDLEYG